jgi:hypothetical protein
MTKQTVTIETVFQNTVAKTGLKWLKIRADGADYQDWEHGHSAQYVAGDQWVFIYDEVQNGAYTNRKLMAGSMKITGEEVAPRGVQSNSTGLTKDESIARAVALKGAVEWLAGTGAPTWQPEAEAMLEWLMGRSEVVEDEGVDLE